MSTAAPKLDLETLLAASQLPALPQSAIALLQMSQRPDVGPADFARPIEADPGLMGQVLRFVNSSYFGFSREIASVPQALTLVGVRAITNFALWNAVFSVIPNPRFGPFDLKGLWQDSLRRALFSRHLGMALELPESEDLFAGALLQDMAIPLLLKKLPEEYQTLVERRASEGRRLSLLERELFGWDHADAAAALVKGWKLPDQFADLIKNHTQLDELLAGGPACRGAACVALASLLPSCADQAWPECPLFTAGYKRLAGARAEAIASVFAEVDSQVADFAPLLKLPLPARSLSELWAVAEGS